MRAKLPTLLLLAFLCAVCAEEDVAEAQTSSENMSGTLTDAQGESPADADVHEEKNSTSLLDTVKEAAKEAADAHVRAVTHLRRPAISWLAWAKSGGDEDASSKPAEDTPPADDADRLRMPRCRRQLFMNTTLPIFLRECASLVDGSQPSFGCSLSCTRAFTVMRHAINAQCISFLLNNRDALQTFAGDLDIPPPSFFSSLFTEAFTRCAAVPAHARGPSRFRHSPFHCTPASKKSFTSTIVPVFIRKCKGMRGTEAGEAPCEEECAHAYGAFAHHPCFSTWFQELHDFRAKRPDDKQATDRLSIVAASTRHCPLPEDFSNGVQNMCSEADYAQFEELRVPALLHACLRRPVAGGDYPSLAEALRHGPDGEGAPVVRACPLTCSNALWHVMQDSHCLQRMQRNSNAAGSGAAFGVFLSSALDQCGLSGRSELGVLLDGDEQASAWPVRAQSESPNASGSKSASYFQGALALGAVFAATFLLATFRRQQLRERASAVEHAA